MPDNEPRIWSARGGVEQYQGFAGHLAAMRPIDLSHFTAWMAASGWIVRGEGALGRLFAFEDATVAVPRELWRDPDVAYGVAGRVAQAMERPLSEVLTRLALPLTDRIELGLVGESLGRGRAPLGAASEVLRNGRRMLSASGTSAVAPSWSIGRRYRREAQELARSAELAHTENGSFVFPLYIALDRTEQPAIAYEEGSVIPESYERRVTRTLATAMATANQLADRRVDELQDSDLDIASSVGVSRELCMSMDDIFRNSAVETVRVAFEWSPAFGPTDSLPSVVTVERERRPQFRDLADRLGRDEPVDPAVYSGPILEIGHGNEPGEGYFIILDTYFREKKSKLRVSLTEAQHERAIPWYQNRATVIVHGEAVQSRSELSMSPPGRIEAWGESRLG